jgi:two-component system chemotaxis sensor kinase CheA
VAGFLRAAGRLGGILGVHPALVHPRGEDRAARLALRLETVLEPEAVARALGKLPSVADVDIEPERWSRSEPPAIRQPVKWIRVRADLVDSLLEATLELLLERARLGHGLGGAPGLGDAARHLDRLELLLRRLHADLTAMRVVAFDTLVPRLVRSVRHLAEQLGKQVELRIEGRKCRLDRSVLDALSEPLSQMLRNAVDHGIERPEERRSAGTPPTGTIVLRVEGGRERVDIALED